jgi:hypothetical protein
VLLTEDYTSGIQCELLASWVWTPNSSLYLHEYAVAALFWRDVPLISLCN